MNKILFKCQYFTIRVREVLILGVVLVLLFFGLKACQNNEKEKQKEEKIVNICGFTNENINDLNKLLSRADLCSEGWFKDLDAYIERIKDQNTYLSKKKEKTDFKKVLKYQKKLLNDLKNFKAEQKDENIEKLKKTFQAYKKFYDGKCTKGIKGK